MAKSRRRDFLILAGIVFGVYGLRALPWSDWTHPAPNYTDIDGLRPFRLLGEGGDVSSTTSPLVGLSATGPRNPMAGPVKADPCRWLSGDGDGQTDLTIAYFSEVRCPACRIMEDRMSRVLPEFGTRIRLVHHELPIFGPPSELAAAAITAAEFQGRAEALRRRLTRAPILVDQSSLMAVAESVGIDPQRLLADMNDPEVQARLDVSRALADLFGFVGTPGLVVGRTVIRGAIPEITLKRVVLNELSNPLADCRVAPG